MAYNPNIDTGFLTPNLCAGVMFGFIIQTVLFCSISHANIISTILLSCFITLFTGWIYLIITMFICLIIGLITGKDYL